MPGQPIIQKQVKRLEDAGEDAVLALISSGKGVIVTMKTFEVGRRAFYKWLDAAEGRKDRYYAARKMWADTLAEECLDIADATVDAHDAQVRKLRIETRKWLAGNVNPDQWRERRDPLVNITLGDQHLQALRQITSVQAIEHDGTEPG